MVLRPGSGGAANGTIRTQSKLARLLDAHAVVGEALLSGRISTDDALQLERVHANPRISHLLGVIVNAYVELAEHSSVREFTGEIDNVIHFADQDGAFADLADNVEGRTASVTDVDGASFVRGAGGDPVECAQIVAVFESFVDGEYRKGLAARRELFGDAAEQHPLARTARQRRFDALRAIFVAAAGSPDANGLPDPEVGIIIDDDTTQHTSTTAGVTLPNGNHANIDADQDPDDTTAESLTDALAVQHKHRAGLTVRRDNRGKPYHLKPERTIILPGGERPPDLTDDESAEHIRQRLAALRPAS